jgi:hypothetical protein
MNQDFSYTLLRDLNPTSMLGEMPSLMPNPINPTTTTGPSSSTSFTSTEDRTFWNLPQSK